MNQMPGTVIAAIRGPIMLIALGGLLILDQLTPYSFGRTWPTLLILFGLLKLLERIFEGGSRPPYPPYGTSSPPPAGGGQ
jgi:hypothetical protein